MDKLIRALAIAAATTVGAAIILQQLDRRARATSDTSDGETLAGVEPHNAEIDADRIDPAQRKAMLAELEAQL